MTEPDVRELMTRHRLLDALLLEHRTALVGLELDRARERLEAFAATLLAHMEHEEREVLPRYAALPRVRGGGVELFSGEHDKLKKLLADLRERASALDARAPGVRGAIVALFDRTALFVGLLEHHDIREGELLYPRLQEALSPEERRAILDSDPGPGAGPASAAPPPSRPSS